jgi:septum formation protein
MPCRPVLGEWRRAVARPAFQVRCGTFMNDLDLVLASASPRRAELLSRLGLRLSIQPAAIDETAHPDERPLDYVKRMAEEKLTAARALISPASPEAELPLLAADTIVVLGGKILGKPGGPDEAGQMLQALSGRRHEVITGFRVARGEQSAARAVSTAVSFRLVAADEVAAYVASGEWRGKAGGYAVQGIAAIFAAEIRGSFTNVVGLPLAEVIADLRAVGGLPRWPPPGFGVAPLDADSGGGG